MRNQEGPPQEAGLRFDGDTFSPLKLRLRVRVVRLLIAQDEAVRDADDVMKREQEA
jgi:hypothetical protein